MNEVSIKGSVIKPHYFNIVKQWIMQYAKKMNIEIKSYDSKGTEGDFVIKVVAQGEKFPEWKSTVSQLVGSYSNDFTMKIVPLKKIIA